MGVLGNVILNSSRYSAVEYPDIRIPVEITTLNSFQVSSDLLNSENLTVANA